MTQKPRARRRRLFWRIYRHGLVLLLLVVVATAIGGWLVGSQFPHSRQARQLALRVAADLGPKIDVTRLKRRVQDIHDLSGANVAAYGPDGQAIATAGAAPPSRPNDDERRLARRGRAFRRGLQLLAAVELKGGGYLVLSWSGRQGLARLVTSLLVILVMVALAAIPLTRAIARPLDRIANTARALGQGDLSVRTGITERRDEVGNLAQVLDEMAERLERTVKAEKELWANISHELRTPVSRIRVALELCAEEAEVEQVRRHLSGINSDLAELEKLMDDVLTTARLDLSGDGGGLVPRKETVDLTTLVDQAGRRLQEHHPDRELIVDLDQDLPPLQADPTLLLRVLGNLLENAAKYSKDNTPVELAAGSAGESLWVEVRDRGVGVDPDDLPRLFEHFFRADRSRTRGSGGTGLGLTLCRRVVEAHGGQIQASRREGGGLTLRFTLPLHSSAPVHTS